MGVQLWGAFGGFQKKTGALVGRWLKGQNVITAIPHPSQLPATTAQLNQRAKFKTVIGFLSWISPLIKVGFKDAHERKQSAFNAAFTYNFLNAVTGIAPDFEMNYPEVVYSKGRLGIAYNAGVLATTAAAIVFDWQTDLSTGIGEPTDMATVMVYNPAKSQFVTLANAAMRSAQTYNLLVPADFSGDEVHCWISMVSADGKIASDSYYIGVIEVL